jgi:4'-phosphopantetheinyl transferase EntD
VEDRIEQQFAGWLRERLGHAVGIAVARLDRVYPLFPEEEAHAAGAVESRRVEFSVGRWCARQALGELGISPQAIQVGMRGAPVWPAGACGSITHSRGLCAAVAARSTEFAGLGIDIVDLEEARSALDSSPSLIATEHEVAAARSAFAESREDEHALAILFSAKESAIKAMSAKFDRYVEFTEVTVGFDGAAFSAECQPFGTHAQGWWAVRGGCGFTAAFIDSLPR